MAVFTKVVDTASFAAAARHFDMSPATVTNHVHALEERLGVRLLNRTTRRVSATEVGQNYYERCARILAELEEADHAAAELQAAPRGRLRVTTSVSFGTRQLAGAIADYLESYPAVSIELGLEDRYVDLLEQRYDLAIRLGRLGDSSLIAKKLYGLEMILCASPRYLAANGTPRTPQDLAHHSCLVYTYAQPQKVWQFTDQSGKKEAVRIDGRFLASSGDALLVFALKDSGILLAPDYLVADELTAGRLIRLLPGHSTQEIPVYAVYPHSRYLTTKARTFVNFLVARFGRVPRERQNDGVGVLTRAVPPDLRVAS